MIEMVFVLILIGVLTSIVAPRVNVFLDDARGARATGDIKAVQADIMNYLTQHDSLPPSLGAIQRSALQDPWGQPYVYSTPGGARLDQFGVPLNTAYDLYSVGADGATAASIMAGASRDDIVLGNDGGFIGLATRY